MEISTCEILKQSKAGRKKRKFYENAFNTHINLKQKTKYELKHITLESYNQYATKIETSPYLTEKQHEIIVKERRLIMNRINAEKSRIRKREYNSSLQARSKQLEQENILMQNKIRELESENRDINTKIVCLILEYNLFT